MIHALTTGRLGRLASMVGADFNPLGLTADASLNHVIIGDYGCPEVTGMRAEEVCSRDALGVLAADCGLPGLRLDRLADDLVSLTASESVREARAATAVLTRFGRRLGALVATLRDPGTPREQGDSPARRAFLSHWLTVDSVWLAGGLLAGRCGRPIAMAAAAAATTAARPCRVALTPYPAVAPLLGAARRSGLATAGEPFIVADLGHTSIRTAIAEQDTTVLTRLRLVDARAAPSQGSASEVEDAVADALADAVRRIPSRRVRLIASVASYVAAGVPIDTGRGVYRGLADRMASLVRRVAVDSGAEVILEFVHDGTAAAAAGGSVNSATITAGTWLGAGFRPAHAPPLLDLGPDLWIGRS